MNRRQRGFGILEALLALALGVMLLAAAAQATVATQQTWRLQGAASRLQDDARLALHRLTQDIRMTGSFGCLALEAIEFSSPATAQAFATPLRIERLADGRVSRLSLIVADLAGNAGHAEWTLLTDCLTQAKLIEGSPPGSGASLALPLRQHTYRVQDGSLMLSGGGRNARLIDNVRGLWVTHVPGEEGGRLDVRLDLFEPVQALEHRYEVSVALRNRVPGS